MKLCKGINTMNGKPKVDSGIAAKAASPLPQSNSNSPQRFCLTLRFVFDPGVNNHLGCSLKCYSIGWHVIISALFYKRNAKLPVVKKDLNINHQLSQGFACRKCGITFSTITAASHTKLQVVLTFDDIRLPQRILGNAEVLIGHGVYNDLGFLWNTITLVDIWLSQR